MVHILHPQDQRVGSDAAQFVFECRNAVKGKRPLGGEECHIGPGLDQLTQLGRDHLICLAAKRLCVRQSRRKFSSELVPPQVTGVT